MQSFLNGLSEKEFYDLLYTTWMVLGAITIIILRFVSAPYGRHAKPNTSWGPLINNRFGWIVMECPSPIGMFIFFMLRDNAPDNDNFVYLLCFALWEYHYIYRSFIFPFKLKSENSIHSKELDQRLPQKRYDDPRGCKCHLLQFCE
jgi:hypothetical protein